MKTELKIAMDLQSKLNEEKSLNIKYLNFKEFPELNKDAFHLNGTLNVPISLIGEKKDLYKNVYIINSINLFCLVDTNHSGVTGKDDIERTLTLTLEINGSQRDFRKHNYYNTTFKKFHNYFRIGDDKNHEEVIKNAVEELVSFYSRSIENLENPDYLIST